MFMASLDHDHKELLKRRSRVSRSLDSLKMKESAFAHEHKALLAYLDDLIAVNQQHKEDNS